MAYGFTSEKEARREAFEVCKSMRIGKWEIRTWHNTGAWHASIFWKHFALHIYPKGYQWDRFSLLIGHDGFGIIDIKTSTGNDPNEVVEKSIQPAIEALRRYTDVADWLKTLLPQE